MVSDIKPPPHTACAATSVEMNFRFVQKQSSNQQQTSDSVKGKILPPRIDTCSHYRDKLKAGRSFGQSFRGANRELRQHERTEHVIQLRSSSENRQMTHQGSKTGKDDELVKHMSNLPNFLQRVEKEKSVQEKALNFGVLDWKRLEMWKYNERMPAKVHRKTLSSNSNSSLLMTSGPPRMSSQLRKQLKLHGLHPVSSSPGKQLSSHGTHFDSSPLRKPFSSHSPHVNISQVERKTGGMEHSKGKSTFVKDLRARSSTMLGQQNFNQQVKSCGSVYSEINTNHCGRNDSVKRAVLDKEALALDQGKNGCSISTPKILDVPDGKSKMRFKNEGNIAPQHCRVEPQNIALLVPRNFTKKSCSDTSQSTKPKTLSHRQLPEAKSKRFSDGSHQELHSGEFATDNPHSCPLSTSAMANKEHAVELPNLVSAEAEDSELWTTAAPDDIPFPPKKCEAKRSFSVDASKIMDIDTEQTSAKGRHPSPNRRFNFSLGKMTRSFSFKESSAAPQLRATCTAPKSGPVGSEFSSSVDNPHKDKEAANSRVRGRSSPLRRLLDPLLKHKAVRSAEIVPPPNGNPDVMPAKPVKTDGPIQEMKYAVSTFQALLQLSMKNGLPFFKLAADNSSNVLAAAVKQLPSSGKGDCSLIYTFYSLHEIKKKSMIWINQGPKGKSCGVGYNIVGQMKISSSYMPQLSSKGSRQCVVRECVLYGVDLAQVDKQTPEFSPNREIAAIVIKNPRERLKDEDLGNEGRSLKDTDFEHCVLGDEKSNSTVVILPVGIHGLPNKGAPSPLIHRWRSGGLCDCGGWDAGCKLRILTNQDRFNRITGPSMHSSAAGRLDFFSQGKERGSKPVFSLEPTRDGLYSVEFNASISLLEAFSICVAIITNRRLSEILDVNDPLGTGHLSEGTVEVNKKKSQTTIQVPVKYVTCPPSSPVGRI